MWTRFPHVLQQGGLVRNRDNRDKQGGLVARPNVSLCTVARMRILPLKSDTFVAFANYHVVERYM